MLLICSWPIDEAVAPIGLVLQWECYQSIPYWLYQHFPFLSSHHVVDVEWMWWVYELILPSSHQSLHSWCVTMSCDVSQILFFWPLFMTCDFFAIFHEPTWSRCKQLHWHLATKSIQKIITFIWHRMHDILANIGKFSFLYVVLSANTGATRRSLSSDHWH